jgi:hypothetical protein
MKSEIVVCPNCHLKVLPKADGTCPNCQTGFSAHLTQTGETDDKVQSYSPKSVNQFPAPKPLSGISRILYSYPTGLLASYLWLAGSALAFLWHTYHPVQFYNSDGITIFIAFFFFGLGILIYAIKGESIRGTTKDTWIAAILSLGLSLLFLFTSIIRIK